jgi:hypothetical protein
VKCKGCFRCDIVDAGSYSVEKRATNDIYIRDRRSREVKILRFGHV